MIPSWPQNAVRHSRLLQLGWTLWMQNLSPETDSLIKNLITSLKHLRGPVMKIAQLTSMLAGVLPPTLQKHLQELCCHAHPMGPSLVRRMLALHLGPLWSQRFASFSMTPAFSASLGQVHRAELPSRQVVACKIQYPDTARALNVDLGHIRRAASLLQRFHKALDVQDLIQELTNHLHQEVDYRAEARHIGWFATFFRDLAQAIPPNAPPLAQAFSQAHTSHIRIPTVTPDQSCEKILTLEWLPGCPLLTFLDPCDPPSPPHSSLTNPAPQKKAPFCSDHSHATSSCDSTAHSSPSSLQQNVKKDQLATCTPLELSTFPSPPLSTLKLDTVPAILSPQERTILAERLLSAWYAPFFCAGLLHGDPHAGNILYDTETGTLGLVDFGCVKVFALDFVHAFCRLYDGFVHEDAAARQQAYADLGLNVPLGPCQRALENWVAFLIRPFVQPGITLLSDRADPLRGQRKLWILMQHLDRYARAQAQTEQEGAAPALRLPAPFLIFERVAMVLGSIFIRLQAQVNWAACFQALRDLFCPHTFQTYQDRILATLSPHVSGLGGQRQA